MIYSNWQARFDTQSLQIRLVNVSVLSFHYQKYTTMQGLTQKTTMSEQKIIQSALKEKNRLFTIKFKYRIHKLQDCGQNSS